MIFVNGDGMPHDLFLRDSDVNTDYVAKSGDETGTVFEVGDMQSGSYVYYRTVPGHLHADQKGKLIVAEISE